MLFACAPANECVPDGASISAAAGVPLVPDVLTVAGFPALFCIPSFVGFTAVAFIPAFAGVSAVAVIPAVDGVFAVSCFPADPGVPVLSDCYFFCYRTIGLSNIGSRPQSIGLLDIGLTKKTFGCPPLMFFIIYLDDSPPNVRRCRRHTHTSQWLLSWMYSIEYKAAQNAFHVNTETVVNKLLKNVASLFLYPAGFPLEKTGEA